MMPALARMPTAALASRGRTLPDLVPVFLQWFRLVRQRSENTCKSYGEDLRMFLTFCAHAKLVEPADVDFRHVEFYLGWLQADRGVKPQTANRHLDTLKAFWKYRFAVWGLTPRSAWSQPR